MVNKDDIRAELTKLGWVWSHENEKDVLEERDNRVRAALREGRDVISSDTNFGRKHKVRLEQLAREAGAEFIVKDFDVPLEVCIERDSKRYGAAHVGEAVIRKMFNQFIVSDPRWEEGKQTLAPVEKVIRDGSLMKAVICDLDGTLALFGGKRGPYDAAKCADDDLNIPVYKILTLFSKYLGYQIVYLSGREDKFRGETVTFLEKHECPVGPLWMRTSGDFRKDTVVKLELFNAHVRGKYDVEFVLDDRDSVVKQWREMGLTCLQVAEGAF